eukprot:GHVL01010196.1.p1 GENE.GHVL01010196.1~~GHVL01010196.1.p1  ORF type:complete len:647 (+),score=91.42 GHVL01010196.1:37-1977(+)
MKYLICRLKQTIQSLFIGMSLISKDFLYLRTHWPESASLKNRPPKSVKITEFRKFNRDAFKSNIRNIYKNIYKKQKKIENIQKTMQNTEKIENIQNNMYPYIHIENINKEKIENIERRKRSRSSAERFSFSDAMMRDLVLPAGENTPIRKSSTRSKIMAQFASTMERYNMHISQDENKDSHEFKDSASYIPPAILPAQFDQKNDNPTDKGTKDQSSSMVPYMPSCIYDGSSGVSSGGVDRSSGIDRSSGGDDPSSGGVDRPSVGVERSSGGVDRSSGVEYVEHLHAWRVTYFDGNRDRTKTFSTKTHGPNARRVALEFRSQLNPQNITYNSVTRSWQVAYTSGDEQRIESFSTETHGYGEARRLAHNFQNYLKQRTFLEFSPIFDLLKEAGVGWMKDSLVNTLTNGDEIESKIIDAVIQMVKMIRPPEWLLSETVIEEMNRRMKNIFETAKRLKCFSRNTDLQNLSSLSLIESQAKDFEKERNERNICEGISKSFPSHNELFSTRETAILRSAFSGVSDVESDTTDIRGLGILLFFLGANLSEFQVKELLTGALITSERFEFEDFMKVVALTIHLDASAARLTLLDSLLTNSDPPNSPDYASESGRESARISGSGYSGQYHGYNRTSPQNYRSDDIVSRNRRRLSE